MTLAPAPALTRPVAATGYAPGPRQCEILRFVADGEWFETSTRSEQNSCVRMLDHGFLIRDPRNSYRFTASATGRAYVEALDRKAIA